ncbi:hypothetical protein MKX03_005580 [Papaver bracteatum]|nr:hypothetical protein MKX03_005580 [Papaver bracteatum]
MERGDGKAVVVAGKTVCVTGGAGYFASWLIMKLLQRGYSVRTTVRSDPIFKEDISHLKALPGATEKLQIFEADLDNPESFDDAIDGCIGVFHVAHAMDLEGKYPLEKTIQTSVEGTLGILRSCVKSNSVKRIVYTSSSAATMGISNYKNVKEIDENMWSEVDNYIRKPGEVSPAGMSYTLSKTLTERAAIRFSEEHGLDLVTILPSMIVGPFITPNLPISISLALSIILGDTAQYKMLGLKPTNAVHIDDAASAQIFLFECQEAKGRHLCSAFDFTVHDVARFVAKKYPELDLPTDLLKAFEEKKPVHLSSEKLLSLGFKFKYGFEGTYGDAIENCREKGFL